MLGILEAIELVIESPAVFAIDNGGKETLNTNPTKKKTSMRSQRSISRQGLQPISKVNSIKKQRR
ncbi:MAG: hypothetical protein DRG78_03445 [Epsilonproteobacteria bacterium]|nr:MAG: hypothetical protein DRG78_03445 [Campylobacterota bacterium]